MSLRIQIRYMAAMVIGVSFTLCIDMVQAEFTGYRLNDITWGLKQYLKSSMNRRRHAA